MNLDHLKYLVTVADQQSISKASQQLHLKQSYLSSIIKNMETHFGATLFERHPRGITLTKDGEYIVSKARDVIKQINEMEAAFLYPSQRKVSALVDTITIYSVPFLNSTTLMNAIELFNTSFPNVNILVQNNPLEQRLSLISQDIKSLALAVIYEPLESFQQKLPEGIVLLHATKTSVFVLASAQNPVAQSYTAMSAHDLLKKNLIAYCPYGTCEDSPVYQILSRYGTPHIKYTVNNSAMLISLLQKEDFYTLGSHRIKQAENLLTIPFKENLEAYFCILIHEDALHSDIMNTFSDILRLQYQYL